MTDLSKNKANFSALTPLSFLYRTASIFPNRFACVYGRRKASYKELYLRCKNIHDNHYTTNIIATDEIRPYIYNIYNVI